MCWVKISPMRCLLRSRNVILLEIAQVTRGPCIHRYCRAIRFPLESANISIYIYVTIARGRERERVTEVKPLSRFKRSTLYRQKVDTLPPLKEGQIWAN